MAPTRKLAELFYDLRAKTEGLDKDLQGAERSFGKFTNYVLKNPLVAITAVGTAMLGVAIKAARMAEEVDKGMRRVQIATGGSVEGMKQLRAEIETLSKATGRSQADLAQAAALAAKSAGSTEEVGQRLSAALTLSQASGEDLTGIIENLDGVLDVFGLKSSDAADALAKLYTTAKGKQPIGDLFATIQAAAPGLVKLGIDLDTATRALTALGEQGLSAKQAATEFKALAAEGKEGAARIRELAGTIPQATDALGEMKKAADLANNSSEALTARLKNEFSAVMIDLGNRILPHVNQMLRNILDTMDILTGKAGGVAAQGPLATVINLGPLVDRLGESGERGAKGIRDLVQASQQLAKALRSNELKLPDLNVAELERLQKALQAMVGSERISATTKSFLEPILTAVDKLIVEAPKAAAAVAKVGTGTAVGGLTAEEIKRRRDAATKASKEATAAAQAQLKIELDAVHKALDEQVAARKKANERIFEAQRDAAKKLAEMAGDTVGVLKTEIEDTVAEFKKLGASDDEIERIVKPLEVALTSAEALKGAVGRIELPAGLAKELADNAQAIKDAAKAASDYEKQMEEARRATLRAADAIADIGNALLSVAGALGLVDQRTQNIARGAINVGAGIVSGNPLQVAAGVGDIITGIRAGNQERAQQHREALDRLESIKKNTGDLLARNVTGNQLADARRAAAAISVLNFSEPNSSRAEIVAAELRRLGISLKDVEAVAAEFGITLEANRQSWTDFKAILDAVDLKAFTDTFEGMLDAAAQARRIFGQQSPLQELFDQARILTKFSPAFAAIFEGLDLAKAEDRAIALERVMEAFGRAMEGDVELGDLTLTQFLDGLGDIGDLIREMIPEIELLGTEFGQITEKMKEAAVAAVTLAEALRDAFQDIDLDAAIFGESVQDTFNKKFSRIIVGLPAPEGTGGFTPGGAFDLSTQAGRDEARAALQSLAISQPDLKPLIASLISDLDRLPELVGEEVGAAVGDAVSGKGTSVSGSLQQLTIFQGDRLITLGETQLLRQTQIRDLIASATATRGQVLQPPAFGAAFGAFGGSSSTVQQGNLNVQIAVHVPPGTTEPAKIADLTVDRLLADAMVRARFLSGSNRAI